MSATSVWSRPQRLALWAVSLGCVAVAGCGGGSAGPKLPTFEGDAIPVSGVIQLDGEPLADAAVTYAFDGKPPAGFINGAGKTDSTGKYSIQAGAKNGVPAGRYKVTVSKLATKDGKPFQENPEQGMDLEQARVSGMIRESLAPRYSDPSVTTLSATITAGQTEPVNFELKSK